MSEVDVTRYITDTFPGVQVIEAGGTRFFFCAGDEEKKFPFTTLVTNDEHDQFSDLNRPSVFRLNIGVSKENWQKLFGEEREDSEFDFAALDTIMPHPVYGKMHWICVLNPGEKTFQTVKTLLIQAYERDAKKQERHGHGED